jgi:hypothetical protein
MRVASLGQPRSVAARRPTGAMGAFMVGTEVGRGCPARAPPTGGEGLARAPTAGASPLVAGGTRSVGGLG